MFVPFISKRSSKLEKRKGGGGGGKGGGGGGGRGGSSSKGGSSSGSKGSSATSPRSKTTALSTSPGLGGSTGRALPLTTYSSTSARVPASASIPAGQPFAGRSEGGAGRAQVYGTRVYGSGYPGVASRGTIGRGFPFFFWPLVWPATLGAGYYTYLIASRDDYGDTANSTRPGGPLFVATFTSSASTDPSINFRILSDSVTIHSLVEDLAAECSSKHLRSSIDTIKGTITAFTDASDSLPRPENVLQYYRASSIALALDGYNNTDIFSDSDSVDVGHALDLSMTGIGAEGLELMNCLNKTIGDAAPLVSAGSSWRMPATMGAEGMFALLLPAAVGLASLMC